MINQRFFKNNNPKTQIERSLDKTEQKLYHEENQSELTFSLIGQWFFPILVITLTTFGIGGIMCEYLPLPLAYGLSLLFAGLIEFAQAALVRPVVKRKANKQFVSSGLILRPILFTALSVGLGVWAFYSVFLQNTKNEALERKSVYVQKSDSITKDYRKNRVLVENQIKTLDAAKAQRYMGLLRPDERQQQTELNHTLSIMDSTYKVDIIVLKKTLGVDQPKVEPHFSSAEFGKWFGAVCACLLIGFLTVYCHYSEFRFHYLVGEEMSVVIMDGDARAVAEKTAQKRAEKIYSESLKEIAQRTGLDLSWQTIRIPPRQITSTIESIAPEEVPAEIEEVQQTPPQPTPSPTPEPVPTPVPIPTASIAMNNNRTVTSGNPDRTVVRGLASLYRNDNTVSVVTQHPVIQQTAEPPRDLGTQITQTETETPNDLGTQITQTETETPNDLGTQVIQDRRQVDHPEIRAAIKTVVPNGQLQITRVNCNAVIAILESSNYPFRSRSLIQRVFYSMKNANQPTNS